MGAVAVVGERERVEAMIRGPRLRLLEALAERPDSAAGLAIRLGLPRQTLNYHLRQLEAAGLVELVEKRGAGNCVERLLAPTVDAVGAAARPKADRASAGNLLSRAAELVRVAAHLLSQKRQMATMTIETEIRFASAAERAAFAVDLREAVQTLAARYHREDAVGGRRFTVLAVAHPTIPARRAR